MADSIDDDLEWLIDDDQEEQQSDEKGEKDSAKVEDDVVESSKSPVPPDTDTDDEDDGLTPAEREILERNTLLNDASDREDYDLINKLEKANADLEKVSDLDSNREVKVMFKKKLVDVEAPPLDYSSDSSTSSSSSSSDSEDEKSKSKPPDKEDSNQDSSSEEKDQNEKILVERGGKFQLVSENEQKDENQSARKKTEKTAIVHPQVRKTEERPSTSGASSSRPTPIERPNSAPLSQSHNYGNYPQSPRPGSASHSNEYSHIKSPYAMSPEMKELMKKRTAARVAREEEERALEKQKQEENRQNANLAWKCWVEKKDNEIKERQRLEEEEMKKNEKKYDSKKEAEEAYRTWLIEKRKQNRKNRMVEQQRQLEVDEGWYRRDRKECDKAYKKWLRKKSAESRTQQMNERKYGQQSRADAYRMRKLQKLIMSIQNSQKYSY